MGAEPLWLLGLAAVLAAGLVAYLVYALIKAEDLE